MTRPTIVSVDPRERTVVLQFAGDPPRYLTVPLRSRIMTTEAAWMAAEWELSETPDDVLAMLESCATAEPDAEINPPIGLLNANDQRDALPDCHDALLAAGFAPTIRKVTRIQQSTAAIYCPRCAHRLTTATSPSAAYITACSVCRTQIGITFDRGEVVVVARILE